MIPDDQSTLFDRRVSTATQAGSGLGLDAQQESIANAAQRTGLELGETFTDAGIS